MQHDIKINPDDTKTEISILMEECDTYIGQFDTKLHHPHQQYYKNSPSQLMHRHWPDPPPIKLSYTAKKAKKIAQYIKRLTQQKKPNTIKG